MRAYEGKIKQFYLGQSRAHALGINENSRGRKQFPDATMTYTNLMGQEIVEIELRPEVVESVGDKIKRRLIPQWAIVNFTLSSDYTPPTLGSGNAHLYSVLLEADVLGFDEQVKIRSRGGGFWFTGGVYGNIISPFRRAAFGGQASGTNVVATSDLVAGTYTTSLLIDLRPYMSDPAGVAVVDVYAMTERKTYEQTGWIHGEDSYSENWLQHLIATGEDDPQLRALASGYDAGRADFISRGYVAGYEYLNIAGHSGDVFDFGIPSGSTMAGLPPLTKSTTQVADPFEMLEHVSWVQDPTSGLLTYFFHVAIRKDEPDPGQSSTRWGPVRTYYTIDPTYGEVERINPSPGTVSARLFYSTPSEWQLIRRTRTANFFEVTNEYLWVPEGITDSSALNLSTIASNVLWPVPREFRIDETSIAIDPGPETPGTKLGTITVVLDEGVIAFAPANQ